jgi:hypothetical protein
MDGAGWHKISLSTQNSRLFKICELFISGILSLKTLVYGCPWLAEISKSKRNENKKGLLW